jgi:hypothetical protein
VVALKASLASQSLISNLKFSMSGKSAITEQRSGASSLPEMQVPSRGCGKCFGATHVSCAQHSQHLLDFKAAFDSALADVQNEAEKASRCEQTLAATGNVTHAT